MKLTPEQKRGIEERFAVLSHHIEADFAALLVAGQDRVPDWWAKIREDVQWCNNEVITLVERLEPEQVREKEDR